MLSINESLSLSALSEKLNRFWSISGEKIRLINAEYDTSQGSPVFTRAGRYTTRGWTEWTQGFEVGSALLQFDATGDQEFLDLGRRQTLDKMAPHLTHIGVHDHGFNNVSTYGNLLRLMLEGKIERNDWEREFYELALKASGAVQAARWTSLPDGGFIPSFNGPHSLFVDTIRSCRSLMVGHQLGHVLQGEADRPISLLERALEHMRATARYSVYYGKGRDQFDVRGRVAHESIFNIHSGEYRCPNTQQGYSGFTTWTRGLSWAMSGFAEELECLDSMGDPALDKESILPEFLNAAKATCDFYIENTPKDGIPYWDTGAPGLVHMGDYLDRPAEPKNDYEPVDSSAAAIGAQGLLRLGKYLGENGAGKRYWQAGLSVLDRLLDDLYVCQQPQHQGLLLHSIYHQPNGWDYVPEGSRIAYGEACMWGDYHLREVALLATKLLKQEPYYTFYGCVR